MEVRHADSKKGAGKKYAIYYPTRITTYGLVKNLYSQEMQSVVTMDDLFDEMTQNLQGNYRPANFSFLLYPHNIF